MSKKQRLFCMVLLVILVLVPACGSRPGSDLSRTSMVSGDDVPDFDHIVLIVFENRDIMQVIGNPLMPTYNMYALQGTLLTQFHAVTHPSLPNYMALIGGDTFGITKNCEDCFIDAPSLPDLIEESGRTWKTYQEDMEDPCALGSQDEDEYVQKHNPFVYFDPIRLDHDRCTRSVVPFETLQQDIENGSLPDFVFITPNMCHNGHDCNLFLADLWLRQTMNQLMPALKEDGGDYLVVLTWDESEPDETASCCGLSEEAGGRVAVVLLSPLVKDHFIDDTPYSHYSLLKTISRAWDLPYLGHAADTETDLIVTPWK